jgi:hypothetical protein
MAAAAGGAGGWWLVASGFWWLVSGWWLVVVVELVALRARQHATRMDKRQQATTPRQTGYMDFLVLKANEERIERSRQWAASGERRSAKKAHTALRSPARSGATSPPFSYLKSIMLEDR